MGCGKCYWESVGFAREDGVGMGVCNSGNVFDKLEQWRRVL